jgi:hypothetical protein
MKKGRITKMWGGLALSVLLAAGVAFGQESNRIDFYLDGKAGTELVKKGSHMISYPDADQGTLEIKVGKKVVAVPFTRQAIANQAEADRVTYRDNGDGTRSIATITPRGRKFTLVLQ